MTDIVDWLRSVEVLSDRLREAADEIERLRAWVRDLNRLVGRFSPLDELSEEELGFSDLGDLEVLDQPEGEPEVHRGP